LKSQIPLKIWRRGHVEVRLTLERSAAKRGVIMRKGKLRSIFFLTLLGVLAVLPSALGAGENKSQEQHPYPARAQERLVKEVGHELRMLPYYSVFDDLEYKVEGYQVQLFGHVTRPTLKSDAANVVKRIEGVESVVNNIQVLPLSPMDDRIRLAEYRAIYSQPTLQKYALQAVPPIHIIVDNGNVTLVGVVANETDKNIANIQANGVPGVFSVKNDLRVEK
jgi:hyperosmotically inducible protein